MFSSLSAFVSPKAWLASYLAQNLAEWFHVEPSTIETNLFQNSGISLRNVLIRSGGHIDSIQMSWSWASTGIVDVSLHVSGVHIILQRQQHNQSQSSAPTKAPPATESADVNSWKATYFQQILDHLTVVVTGFFVSIEVDKEAFIEVSLERADLKTIAAKDTKLDQRLEISGFQSKISLKEQGHDLPLLEPCSGVAQVKRISGRRFVDGVLTGLLIESHEFSSIKCHLGPVQVRTLMLAHKTWTGNFSSTDPTSTKQADSSQMKLDMPFIGLVLENGMVMSCRECHLDYHFDGSVFKIFCDSGLFVDDNPIMRSTHPVLIDFLNRHVGIVEAEFQDACDPDADGTTIAIPTMLFEIDHIKLQNIVNGTRSSLDLLARESLNHHEHDNIQTDTSTEAMWFFDPGELVSMKWKGRNCGLIDMNITAMKARGNSSAHNVTFDKIDIVADKFQISLPSGSIDNAKNLKFNGNVHAEITCCPTAIATVITAICNEFNECLGVKQQNESGTPAYFQLPFSMLIPVLGIRFGGSVPGKLSLEQVEMNHSDSSITVRTLGISGMLKGAMMNCNNICISDIDVDGGTVRLDVSKMILPDKFQLLEPIDDLQINLEENFLSVNISNQVTVAYLGEDRKGEHKKESTGISMELPFDVQCALGRLVVSRNRTSVNSSWNSVVMDSIQVNVDRTTSESLVLLSSLGYNHVEIASENGLRVSSDSQQIRCQVHLGELLRLELSDAIDLRIISQNHHCLDITANCLSICQFMEQPAENESKCGLPVAMGWKALNVVYSSSTGMLKVDLDRCESFPDQKKISFPGESRIKMSSLDVLTSLQLFCNEILQSYSSDQKASTNPTNDNDRSLDVQLEMSNLHIFVEDKSGEIALTGIHVSDEAIGCDSMEVKGFFGVKNFIFRSLCLGPYAVKENLFRTSWCVKEASAAGVGRLSMPLEQAAITLQRNAVSVELSSLFVEEFRDKSPKSATSHWSATVDNFLLSAEMLNSESGSVAASLEWKSLKVGNGNGFFLSSDDQTLKAKIQGTTQLNFDCSISCNMVTPSGTSTKVTLDHPVFKSDIEQQTKGEPGKKLPFQFAWNSLEILQHYSTEKLLLKVASASSSSDGLLVSIPCEALITMSSFSVIDPLERFWGEIFALGTDELSETNDKSNEMGGLPCRLQVKSCCINIEDQRGQILIQDINAEDMSVTCKSTQVSGFFENGIIDLRSIRVIYFIDRNQSPCFQSSFSVAEAYSKDMFRLSFPIENLCCNYEDNTLSLDLPAVEMEVFADLTSNDSGVADGAEKTFEANFGFNISVQSAKLHNSPPDGRRESDVWHFVESKELNFSYSLAHHCTFRSKVFNFRREGSLPQIAEVSDINIDAQLGSSAGQPSSQLKVANVGEILHLKANIGQARSFKGAGGTLVCPMNEITGVLEGGIFIVQCSVLEWNLDKPIPGVGPGSIPFALPCPIQFHLDGILLYQTHSNDKIMKLASVGTASAIVEPMSDSLDVQARIIEAADLDYLNMLRVGSLRASAVLRAERLDILSMATVDLDSAELSANFTCNYWNQPFENTSQSTVYQLPHVRISDLELILNFQGRVTRIKDTKLKLDCFTGKEDTDSNALTAYYVKQVKKRIPYLILKTDVLGTSVGDTILTTTSGVALKSTVGGSVLGTVAYDTFASAITAGKASRGASESERYKFGDLSRGAVASVGKAAEAGAAMRGDSKYRVGDFTRGASAASAKYTSDNRVRLSTAGGSGLGMAAGLALAGPVGMVAGAVIAGRAAGGAVSSLTGDPNKEKSRSGHAASGSNQTSHQQNAANSRRMLETDQSSMVAQSALKTPNPTTQVDFLSAPSSSPATASFVHRSGPGHAPTDPFAPALSGGSSRSNTTPDDPFAPLMTTAPAGSSGSSATRDPYTPTPTTDGFPPEAIATPLHPYAPVAAATTEGRSDPFDPLVNPPQHVGSPRPTPSVRDPVDPFGVEYSQQYQAPAQNLANYQVSSHHSQTTTSSSYATNNNPNYYGTHQGQPQPQPQPHPFNPSASHTTTRAHHPMSQWNPQPQAYLSPNMSNPALHQNQAAVQRSNPMAHPPHNEGDPSARGYKFGDISRGIVARGKEKRGENANSNYKFGDFTRGLFGGS